METEHPESVNDFEKLLTDIDNICNAAEQIAEIAERHGLVTRELRQEMNADVKDFRSGVSKMEKIVALVTTIVTTVLALIVEVM